jgi:hypothetical protein
VGKKREHSKLGGAPGFGQIGDTGDLVGPSTRGAKLPFWWIRRICRSARDGGFRGRRSCDGELSSEPGEGAQVRLAGSSGSTGHGRVFAAMSADACVRSRFSRDAARRPSTPATAIITVSANNPPISSSPLDHEAQ